MYSQDILGKHSPKCVKNGEGIFVKGAPLVSLRLYYSIIKSGKISVEQIWRFF